ncbi:MAG: hypothetical protein ABI867_44155 [Kofleriaceae bacterium]
MTKPDFKNAPPEKLRAGLEAAFAAVRRYNAGQPIEQCCPFCEQLLGVEGLPPEAPSAWHVYCPCGATTTTLKGL